MTSSMIAKNASAADDAQDSTNRWFEWNFQGTAISQTLFRFRSPYQGNASLLSRDETEITHAELLSGKAHLTDHILADVDLANARGQGVGGGNATGLAGFANNQVIRISTVSKDPYFARFFVQWTQPVSKGEQVIISIGKLAASDTFDKNNYANSVDTQFINGGFVNNLAYDFAADTRGYSGGIAVQWIHPNWILRLGSFQMPVKANGIRLSNDFAHSRGDQIELEIRPQIFTLSLPPSIVRFLIYQNHAHMGNYNDAATVAQQMGTTPDIVSVEKINAVKYGFALNGEQPLGDDGDTGVFFRYGWNDGKTESFAYTEADRFVSFGLQISGKRWKAPLDHAGLGFEQSDISLSHAQYLALGGSGFQLGDGRLNYGSEKTLETYYARGISKSFAVSLDYQRTVNPGYNRDRGPINLLSLRLHWEH